MMRFKTLALVLAAGCAVSASAQIAPLDRAKEAQARATAASRGTAEQQNAVNQQDSVAPPPSQMVTGTAVSSTKGGAMKAAPAATQQGPAAKSKTAKGSKTDAAKPAAEAAAPAPEMAAAAPAKRRDPFISPVVRATAGGPQPACTTGKRCLSPNEISVRGIVRSQNGMIAVVENAARRTYFLRENDQIFNGVVQKITGDSIVIREDTLDNLGKTSTREVVKKLPPSA